MSITPEFDVAIIGGGAAGYSAALYASRASLRAVVLEQGMPGGQIATTADVDNYPAIPMISGAELGDKFQKHAESAGAITRTASVGALEPKEDGSFLIKTNSDELEVPAVILAMGASPRPGGFEGEDAFRGRGISYCATCDAMFYRGKDVYVIGGGNTACEDALYLARVANSVTMVLRRDVFRATRNLVERVLAHDKIKVRYLTSIVSVGGEGLISEISFKNNTDDVVSTEQVEPGSTGIFVATGYLPKTDLVEGLLELAPDGGITTNDAMATSIPGLFAAGDIRSKRLRQVITAAADGAIAGSSAYTYLEESGQLS
ncbi:FAD-dependent oxidoreductase [Collinsella sp. AGMB00827]|uniref:FAD-dependent oxidoreductase n=1 Tax=Collinsella ureilytica TaxID=2869515 RepID=A0ABS7ML35_9ACTN|nr:FAD-dependent oxidoreductase [Collinsella urealyticum]MBY4798002.1 FAD-dependent oxidoreductase [Collinsella urealyticum]